MGNLNQTVISPLQDCYKAANRLDELISQLYEKTQFYLSANFPPVAMSSNSKETKNPVEARSDFRVDVNNLESFLVNLIDRLTEFNNRLDI